MWPVNHVNKIACWQKPCRWHYWLGNPTSAVVLSRGQVVPLTEQPLLLDAVDEAGPQGLPLPPGAVRLQRAVEVSLLPPGEALAESERVIPVRRRPQRSVRCIRS